MAHVLPPLSGNQRNQQWRIPCALTIALHCIVLLLSLLPPSLFYRRPPLPEVITINLFNAVETPVKKPPAKRKRPAKRVQVKKKTPPPPVVKKETHSLAVKPPPPAVSSAPTKVTSLAPRKIKKKLPPPVPKKKEFNDKKRLQALERLQARMNKKKEDEKLKHDLAKLRESLHTSPIPQPTPEPNEPEIEEVPQESGSTNAPAEEPSGPSSGNAELMDIALKRYYIAISRRIHENWVLPEMQDWDETLEALVVVIVRRDGRVRKSFFEKQSDNPYFNTFVEKTIKASSPLPPFPSDLKKNELEIGLRFHPSGLY